MSEGRKTDSQAGWEENELVKHEERMSEGREADKRAGLERN
jgi:hypothetical protein